MQLFQSTFFSILIGLFAVLQVIRVRIANVGDAVLQILIHHVNWRRFWVILTGCGGAFQIFEQHHQRRNEIMARIFNTKLAFTNKLILFTSKLGLEHRKKLLKWYDWSTALYGSETWTLWSVEKHINYVGGAAKSRRGSNHIQHLPTEKLIG